MRVMDSFIILIVLMVSQNIHISKQIKLYNLNMCTLEYFNCTLIKLKKKIMRGQKETTFDEICCRRSRGMSC